MSSLVYYSQMINSLDSKRKKFYNFSSNLSGFIQDLQKIISEIEEVNNGLNESFTINSQIAKNVELNKVKNDIKNIISNTNSIFSEINGQISSIGASIDYYLYLYDLAKSGSASNDKN